MPPSTCKVSSSSSGGCCCGSSSSSSSSSASSGSAPSSQSVSAGSSASSSGSGPGSLSASMSVPLVKVNSCGCEFMPYQWSWVVRGIGLRGYSTICCPVSPGGPPTGSCDPSLHPGATNCDELNGEFTLTFQGNDPTYGCPYWTSAERLDWTNCGPDGGCSNAPAWTLVLACTDFPQTPFGACPSLITGDSGSIVGQGFDIDGCGTYAPITWEGGDCGSDFGGSPPPSCAAWSGPALFPCTAATLWQFVCRAGCCDDNPQIPFNCDYRCASGELTPL